MQPAMWPLNQAQGQLPRKRTRTGGRAGEGRQRCSLTLLMLITSIYCAHNMGAAPNQQLLPHLPILNSAAPWTSFLLLFLLLRLRATHASLDTLWGPWWPPHYPTLLLWTLFSFLFLYTPPGKIQLSNASFSSRFYFPSFFFFVFSSFPLRIFFFVSAESIPRRTFSVSAFICC